MESTLIVSGNLNATRTKTGRETKVKKGPDKVWIRLTLLFILIVLVKGLLIACATVLLRMHTSECQQSNRSYERNESTERELLQLRVDLQKLRALLHNVTKDSRCQLCPPQWHWHWGQCYFFSMGLEINRKWAKSAEYCQEQNASLAVIQDVTEMGFILGHMMTFSETPFLWLGLADSQKEGMWIWQDGTPLHKHSIRIQWDSEQRDCADIRGDGSVFASDCNSYGPWLCKKSSISMTV